MGPLWEIASAAHLTISCYLSIYIYINKLKYEILLRALRSREDHRRRKRRWWRCSPRPPLHGPFVATSTAAASSLPRSICTAAWSSHIRNLMLPVLRLGESWGLFPSSAPRRSGRLSRLLASPALAPPPSASASRSPWPSMRLLWPWRSASRMTSSLRPSASGFAPSTTSLTSHPVTRWAFPKSLDLRPCHSFDLFLDGRCQIYSQ